MRVSMIARSIIAVVFIAWRFGEILLTGEIQCARRNDEKTSHGCIWTSSFLRYSAFVLRHSPISTAVKNAHLQRDRRHPESFRDYNIMSRILWTASFQAT